MPSLSIKIFADGADVETMWELSRDPLICGFTTNPTLMRKSGVVDYSGFAHKVLEQVVDKPVCFEVFSDEFDEMERQARLISGWGPNVYVKVPVTNTRGESAADLIEKLSADGIRLNVTALLSLNQVSAVTESLAASPGAIVSVFAGRIADTGRDPVPLMSEAMEIVRANPRVELLWASPREVLNVAQAESVQCHIITLTPDLISKLKGFGRNLDDVSLDTVRMFYSDAQASGYLL